MAPRLRVRSFSLAAVALVALVACGSAAPPAATIGGTTVTDEQLAHEEKVFTFLAGLNNHACGTAAQGESARSACARFALTNIIQESAIASYAKAHGVTVTNSQIQQSLQGLDSQVGASKVASLLEQNGLTRKDLAELAHRVLLFKAVQTAVTAAGISDAELHQLYQQQILDYTTIQVDHILVKTKAEAEKVYRQVTAPGATEQDFLDLAKKVSIDPSAAQNSGSLGSATASQLVPEFAQAAVALQPGQISEPVKTQFGWHVIRMVKKQVLPFDQAKQKLIDSRSIVVFNQWLRDQLTRMGVTVNPKYGRYDMTNLEVARISSTAASGSAPPGTPSAATPSP